MPSRKTNETDAPNNGDGFSKSTGAWFPNKLKMCNKSLFAGMKFTLVQLSDSDIQKRKLKNMCTHFPGALWELICRSDDIGDIANVAFTSYLRQLLVDKADRVNSQ